MFISPELIKIIAPKDYWVGINILMPIVISGYFRFLYSLPVNYEFLSQNTIYITSGTVLAAVINLCLNYIFIPKYGYVAAAYTTLLAYFFQFLFHYFIYYKLSEVRLFQFRSFILSMIFVLINTIFFLNYLNDYVYRYIYLILVILISGIVLKKKGMKL